MNKYIVRDNYNNALYMVGTVKQIQERLNVSEAVVRMAVLRKTRINSRYSVIKLS